MKQRGEERKKRTGTALRNTTKTVRPTFIVAEPEPEQALSSRKLLLETFKYNVVTAHSVEETLGELELFPNVNALILHCGIPGFDAEDLISTVKNTNPELIVIALTPDATRTFRKADHVVHTHDPQALLDLTHALFGDPRKHHTASKQSPLDPQER